MEIQIAKYAGYCYGVERALKMAEDALSKNLLPIYTLGPIIHNPQVVKNLKRKGITPVENLSQVKEGTVIIRSHGVSPQTLAEIKARKLKIIDATCPFVKKAQHCAASLAKEGYKVVIIGEKDHPEVQGLIGYAGKDSQVIEGLKELDSLKKANKLGLVVQTTQSTENFQKIVSQVILKGFEVKIFNTICGATQKRQENARKMAIKTDVMIVVGGKNSANTTRLFQLCLERNPRTYHIETANELKKEWFKEHDIVGITAGASTPKDILEKVVKKISRLF